MRDKETGKYVGNSEEELMIQNKNNTANLQSTWNKKYMTITCAMEEND